MPQISIVVLLSPRAQRALEGTCARVDDVISDIVTEVTGVPKTETDLVIIPALHSRGGDVWIQLSDSRRAWHDRIETAKVVEQKVGGVLAHLTCSCRIA